MSERFTLAIPTVRNVLLLADRLGRSAAPKDAIRATLIAFMLSCLGAACGGDGAQRTMVQRSSTPVAAALLRPLSAIPAQRLSAEPPVLRPRLPQNSILYPAGWNLIGVTDSTVLPDDLYRWDPVAASYAVVASGTPLSAGEGYWAYFAAATTIALAASERLAIQIQAPAGAWVLAGNPSGQSPATVSGADSVYTWNPVDGGYTATTTLVPGAGAWVRSEVGGQLTIGVPGRPSSTNAILHCTAEVIPVGAAINRYGVSCTVSGAPANDTAVTVTAFSDAGEPLCTTGLSQGSGSCSGRLTVPLDGPQPPLVFYAILVPSGTNAVDQQPEIQPLRRPVRPSSKAVSPQQPIQGRPRRARAPVWRARWGNTM